MFFVDDYGIGIGGVNSDKEVFVGVNIVCV